MPSLKVPRCSASMGIFKGDCMCWLGPQLLMVVLTQECLKLKCLIQKGMSGQRYHKYQLKDLKVKKKSTKGRDFKACSASFSKKVINKRKQLDYKLKPNSNTSTFILVCFLFMV